MTRERDVETQLVRSVRAVHGLCFKFVSPANRGVPDRIVFLPGGLVLLVECKRPGGRLTRLQRHVHAQLKALGQRVEVVDSTEMARTAPKLWLQGLL